MSVVIKSLLESYFETSALMYAYNNKLSKFTYKYKNMNVFIIYLYHMGI